MIFHVPHLNLAQLTPWWNRTLSHLRFDIRFRYANDPYLKLNFIGDDLERHWGKASSILLLQVLWFQLRFCNVLFFLFHGLL